jgi:SNF2 family DNA or RNA helicase
MPMTLDDLMLASGVHNHPTWFSKIELLHWPMPHQMQMIHAYPRYYRYGDFGEPGIGKTYPAQVHAILMAALGNKVVFVMPPAPIIQFMREFEDFFKNIRKYLKIEHLDVSSSKKKKLVSEWEKDGWPDILIMSYDIFRVYNDHSSVKNIGNNLWRVRNMAKVGTPEEFATPYFDAEGNPAYEKATPYTPDGRIITIRKGKGKAKNPHQNLLKERGYNVLFFDEAHALCGMDSIISKSVVEMSRILKDDVAIYLMSGTPVPTHLHDCYGLIRLINPEAYLNKAAFLRQHCIIKEFRVPLPGGREKTIKQIADYVNPEKIFESLWANASRVQKRDVIELPEPIISEYPVRLTGAHAKLYRNVVNDKFAILGDLVISPQSISEMRHTALRLISCPEEYGYTGENQLATATDQLIDSIKPNVERKVIIFAFYRGAVDQLAKRYAHLKPCVIYGGTKGAQDEIDRFKNDEDSNLLIINWISGGAALNLQVASYIIFYECPTSPKDAKQALARAYRKGQLKIVNVYFMRVLGTLSDKNFKNLLKNEESNNRAIRDKHDLLHELMAA